MLKTKEAITLSKKQQRFLDRVIGLFGCVPPTYGYDCIIANNIVAVKFNKETVTQLIQNAPHTRNKFHRILCEQLAKCDGIARCSVDDTFNPNHGIRLAKLRFIRKVANLHMGCYKQIHGEMTRKFETTKTMVEETVERINTAIGKHE